MRSISQSFGIFLFIALLFIKVSAVHSYCHDDSNETQDCAVCAISLENQQEGFDFAYAFEFVPESTISIQEQPTIYKGISITTEFKFYLFGRPPPAPSFI
ncbi:hypothetical protein [uncultured Croceitalea sp.]|uniref:hypothetical protein n=1 Tax=uncultured Croceitalea sp. TaxID=1798908 RepID=UPI00330674F5